MRCILCGRLTTPAVLLGEQPVGPKCAAKAGLMKLAKQGKSRVRLFTGPRVPKTDVFTRDLFEELDA